MSLPLVAWVVACLMGCHCSARFACEVRVASWCVCVCVCVCACARIRLCVCMYCIIMCVTIVFSVCLSLAPMGSPSRGGGVSRLSLPTPFSPIFVCPSAYRNLSPVLLFTHQLLPTYLQFSSSDCPFCLHRPFTYISLLYKPSFCHFSFSLWSTRDPAR